MGLKLYLTTIFELLGWILFGPICHVFATQHLKERQNLIMLSLTRSN